jgi:hypothetical protein
MRWVLLMAALAGCAKGLTPQEVRGLAMLHELREVVPDEGCCCD